MVTPAPMPEPELLYNVPLDVDLQRFIRGECEARGVPFEIALALIALESNFTPDVISPTDDYGLMQINRYNHEWLGETLGLYDFLDPRQNVVAGCYILGMDFEKYDDPHQALMAYNMGDTGMQRAWDKGTRQTEYSRRIVELAEKIATGEAQW